jgi:tetratricopeptide (TPR) repeat protein
MKHLSFYFIRFYVNYSKAGIFSKDVSFTIILLLFVHLGIKLNAQNSLQQNTAVMTLLKQGANKMYNYDFDGADMLFNQAEKLLPKHPAPMLLKAVNLYWRYLPLEEGNVNIPQMVKCLNATITLAQAIQEDKEDDPEAIFFELTARSLLMQHYSKNGQHMKALGEAKTLYSLVKDGFTLKEKYNEFYFTTGIYNYYREAYPEAKPVYKPFVWVFQSGNKALGLQQLVHSTKNTVIAQTQAYAFLTHIYLTYENNLNKAVNYAKDLVNIYPNNRFFVCKYIETLLLSKQYDTAEPYLRKMQQETSAEKFTPIINTVFLGVLEEKKYKNYPLASQYYLKAIENASKFGEIGKQYKAYAYLGLSRIAALQNQGQVARTYRKQAEAIAEYPYIFAFE